MTMDVQSPPYPPNITPAQPVRHFPLTQVLLALLVLLLSSTILLAYQNVQLKKQIALLRAIPSPTPTPSDNPTANWKTYTNNQIGFTLKYPETLSMNNISYYDPQSIRVKTFLFGFHLNNSNDQNAYSFAVYSTNEVLDNWIKQNTNTVLPQVSDIISQKQVQIGSLDTYQIQYKYGTIFLFYNNGRIFRLDNSFGSADVSTQILSTFKFIDQNNETPTGTYTCPQNGYVDCMPSPNAGVKYECTPEAFAWFKANCPDFKGGAL